MFSRPRAEQPKAFRSRNQCAGPVRRKPLTASGIPAPTRCRRGPRPSPRSQRQVRGSPLAAVATCLSRYPPTASARRVAHRCQTSQTPLSAQRAELSTSIRKVCARQPLQLQPRLLESRLPECTLHAAQLLFNFDLIYLASKRWHCSDPFSRLASRRPVILPKPRWMCCDSRAPPPPSSTTSLCTHLTHTYACACGHSPRIYHQGETPEQARARVRQEMYSASPEYAALADAGGLAGADTPIRACGAHMATCGKGWQPDCARLCGPVIGLIYLTMALVSQRTCTPMRTVRIRNYPWLHLDIPPQHVHAEGLSSYVPCVSSVPLQRTQILGKIPFTTASTSRGTPPKSEPQVLSSCPRMRILNLNR